MKSRQIAALLFAVLPVVTTACAGGSPCEDNGVTVVIVDNHPTGDHQLVVTADDVLAAEDVTYDIQGDNTGHGHSLTVTAADFADLEAGDEVTLTSSDGGAVGQDHTHDVVLDCDPE
jgi:hypothetical protein